MSYSRFKHRQNTPDLLHPRTKLGSQLVWRKLLDDAVLVETERAHPDVRPLRITIRTLGPSMQRVGDTLDLVVPTICVGGSLHMAFVFELSTLDLCPTATIGHAS